MGKDAKASRSLVLGRIGQDSGRRTSHREIKQEGDRERSHFCSKAWQHPLLQLGHKQGARSSIWDGLTLSQQVTVSRLINISQLWTEVVLGLDQWKNDEDSVCAKCLSGREHFTSAISFFIFFNYFTWEPDGEKITQLKQPLYFCTI